MKNDKLNKKTGMTFIEVIMSIVILSTISIIVQYTSLVLVYKAKSILNIEINRVTKSYLTQGKALCQSNIGASPWNYTHAINDNTNALITITCSLVSGGPLKEVNVTVIVSDIPVTKTEKGYI